MLNEKCKCGTTRTSRFTGEIVKSPEGVNYEVGVKKEWADGKLFTNLSLYAITRTNVRSADLA